MQAYLLELQSDAVKAISEARTETQLEKLRVKYLGRKNGILKKIFDDLADMSVEDKRLIGPLANQVKREIEERIEEKAKSTKLLIKSVKASDNLQVKDKVPEGKQTDITLPSTAPVLGTLNPLTLAIEDTKKIYGSLGFTWWDGPEIETDEYNFQKLLLNPDHPSRDTQDTYYVSLQSEGREKEKLLLRTHTSSMQVRFLESHKPPVRVLFPGRVYRRDAIDATHLPTFHQIEGVLVGEAIKLTDLLGTIKYYITKMFGEKVKVRFYGHNFAYTEPSIEVEMFYRGRWLEILGAGMIHPGVIKNAGLDPDKYTGFAFGMGAERLAMIKYEIEDIRHFYNGDLRFLKQF